MASRLQIITIHCAILIIIIQHIYSQEIVVGPNGTISVEQYTPVPLRCSVTNFEFATQVISWVIDDHPISYDAKIDSEVLDGLLGQGESVRYEVIVSVTDSVVSVNMNIASAQGVDDGRNFGCVVCGRRDDDRKCNGRFQVESDKVKLDVNYRPNTNAYPQCFSHLPEHDEPHDSVNQATVVFGQPAVLNCTSETAKPPVTLKWIKNGVDIEGTSSESGDFSYLNYQFTAALSDKGAKFRCTLRSDYFKLDAECVLPPVKVVSYPEVFIKSPGSVAAGKIHEFACKASSNTSNSKLFKYEWSWDPTFSKPLINTTEYGSVLSTEALNDDDGDEIKCTVTDTDGMKAFAVASIKIQSKLSVGAIAGIAAAGVFCIGLLVLVIFIVVSKKKSNKKRKEQPAPPSAVPMLPSSIKPSKLDEV